MKKIADYVKWFLYITTGILIVCGVNMEMMGMDMIPLKTLWQILLSGFLTTAVTVLLLPTELAGKVETCVKFLLHYVSLCIVMILCGNWFGWLDLDFKGILMMVVSVAGVYLLAFAAYYLIELRQANRINQKLKEKYGDEE